MSITKILPDMKYEERLLWKYQDIPVQSRTRTPGYNSISACDLYSLTCGVLFGELTLNSTCYDTKSYSSLNDVYVYVTANTRLD